MTQRREIELLAHHSPVVRAWLTVHERTGLAWETTLEKLVIDLARENKRLFDHAVDAEMRAVPRHLVSPLLALTQGTVR